MLYLNIMKVLIIEDDKILRESLQSYLKTQNIDCHYLVDERDYGINLHTNVYDAIIIDLMLKYIDGEDILKGIREKGIVTPILILTAKSSITDKEKCFSNGADDYLVKPFNVKELVFRLQALSKRIHIQKIVRIGNVTADLDGQTLSCSDGELRVSKRMWSLLRLLISRRGKIVGTDKIISYVWGNEPVGDDTVRAYIKNLRKVLPKSSITTYKGQGYKLN